MGGMHCLPSLRQFRLQSAQGEGLAAGSARNQPVPLRHRQAWAMDGHCAGRRSARPAEALRSIHNAGYADIQHTGHRATVSRAITRAIARFRRSREYGRGIITSNTMGGVNQTLTRR